MPERPDYYEPGANPAMPYDRTDRFTTPYVKRAKPSGWDPNRPWDVYGGGREGANQKLFEQPPWSDLKVYSTPSYRRRPRPDVIARMDITNPIYHPQLGREMPAGREGYFNPWDDPPPTTENIDRILKGMAPTSSEKFIRENSTMVNQ